MPISLRKQKTLLFLLTSFLISLTLFLHLPTLPHSKSAPFFSKRFSRSNSLEILRGTWILVAGDSQARLLVLALLRILLHPDELASIEPDLFKRHSDYHLDLHDQDMKIDFVWAPYESNLTHLLQEINLAPRCPEIIVIGSGLWHMLHITNPLKYGNSLSEIKQSADSFDKHVTMFWLGLPELVNELLNTDEKKERMNGTMVNDYNRQVEERRILKRNGGPFDLVDFGALTRSCGVKCTRDGMHYDGTVYDAAVNIVLNSFVIASQGRL